MVIVLKQQKHLKYFMEGKISIVVSLTEQKYEELYVNKLVVYNPRNYIKLTYLHTILHIFVQLN